MSEVHDAVENAEAFEQLRAMTVECPCHETENGYAGCKSCVVDKATMAYYEDDGSVSHEGCLNCQGTGLVPSLGIGGTGTGARMMTDAQARGDE